MKQIFALLLFVGTSYGAFEWQQLPAYPRSMGVAFTAISQEADALFWNPAGLSLGSHRISLLLSYEKPFGGLNSQLRDGLVAVAKKAGTVGLGLSFGDYGAHLSGDYEGAYSEQIMGFGVAVPLNKNLTFGAKFNYYRLSMPRFNSIGTFSMDAGVIASFYGRWSVGLLARNFTASSFNTAEGNRYRLPASLSFGVSLIPLRNTLTSVDIRKEYDRPVTIAVGQSVAIGRFILRGGVQSQGDYLQFGLGFSAGFRGFNVDYAATVVPDFPVTHTFTIRFGR